MCSPEAEETRMCSLANAKAGMDNLAKERSMALQKKEKDVWSYKF